MGKITINKEKCKSCSYCIIFCPKKLISLSKDFNSRGFFFAEFADKGGVCTGCTFCALVCPDFAIEVYK